MTPDGIGADLAVRTVKPLLDLGQELIELPFPTHRLGEIAELAAVALRHPLSDRGVGKVMEW